MADTDNKESWLTYLLKVVVWLGVNGVILLIGSFGWPWLFVLVLLVLWNVVVVVFALPGRKKKRSTMDFFKGGHH